jgi:hypothetical protein
VPMVITETLRPDRPRCRYSIAPSPIARRIWPQAGGNGNRWQASGQVRRWHSATLG